MTSTKTFAVLNPANGEEVGRAPDCGVAEARVAVDRVAAAFPAWRDRTGFDRSKLLRKWFDLILANEAELARLMAQEMGKPVTEALGEVRYAAGFVEWYAEEAKRVEGTMIPSASAAKRLFAMRQAVGPVYAITPWNFPAAMVTRKVAPALAAGCTVILKPAEDTPLTALRLEALWQEAGGPADAFVVLPAADPIAISAEIMADHRIRKLTFTGSTEVGMKLYAQAASDMKRLSLELGGNAPFLVFDDADVDVAVRELMASKFRNAGQTCVCANRVYVQNGIHDSFVEKFSAAVRALRVGDPLDSSTQIGPLVNAAAVTKVREHVADAKEKGANVVTGGISEDGRYFAPTVLTGITKGMRILEEETFGPVAPIMKFSTEAEAITMANDTPFGLAAYLCTRDLGRAFRVSEALQYGIVGVNDGLPAAPHTPFGGVKHSGIGREGGRWGLEEYLETKYVAMQLSGPVD